MQLNVMINKIKHINNNTTLLLRHNEYLSQVNREALDIKRAEATCNVFFEKTASGVEMSVCINSLA